MLIINNSQGQDPSFSSFYFNQLYFNPAFCGASGGCNLSATYRSLWSKIPGEYNTQKFSADWDISYFGIGGLGIIATSDGEGPASLFGKGNLNTFSLGIPISFRPQKFITNNNSSSWNFQFGVLPAIIQKNINWSKLIFSDQYSSVNGSFIPESNFSNPDRNVGNFKFDISSGLMIDKRFKFYNEKSINITLGIACQHMLEPIYFFDNYPSKLPKKWVGNANFNIEANSFLTLTPSIIYEKQAEMKTVLAGTNFLYSNRFYIGTWYRHGFNGDAIILFLGLNIDPKIFDVSQTFISYSYDVTISKLTNAASGGSHEINLSINIPYTTSCNSKYNDPFKFITAPFREKKKNEVTYRKKSKKQRASAKRQRTKKHKKNKNPL